MKYNRVMWGLVLFTMAVSFGTISSQSQKSAPSSQNHQVNGLNKYPVADYDAAEPANLTEREERKEKSKRYDRRDFVIPNPNNPNVIGSTIYDAEPVPSELPYEDSQLVITGQILNAKAFMSNDKSAVYSEYIVQIDRVLRQLAERELHKGQVISVDRTGGYVRYPGGQTILYLNSWQDLPELGQHYLFFLGNEDGKRLNYKIITAYKLKDGKVSALDRPAKFHLFDGKDQSKLIEKVCAGNNR